jgi:hypothetical protein
MRAVKTHVGRCMVSIEGKQCGKPAAYAQLLAAGRQFLFCEEHVPKTVERAAKLADKQGAQH